MAMTVPEAFETGTEAFNAHDIGWFADGSRTTSSSKRQAGRAVKERPSHWPLGREGAWR